MAVNNLTVSRKTGKITKPRHVKSGRFQSYSTPAGIIGVGKTPVVRKKRKPKK